MARVLKPLVCALLVAVPFLLPSGDTARLAALEAYQVLLQGEAGETPADELLAAAPVRPDGVRELRLYGANVRGTALGSPAVNDFRDSVVRALRQAAQAAGLPLEVVGDRMPDLRGPEVAGSFELLVLARGALRVDYQPPAGGEPRSWELDWVAPRRTSLLPPIVAIVLAILTRRPVTSLLCGVLAGGFLFHRAREAGVLASLALGVRDTGTVYFWEELVDPERAYIVAFVVFMLAMVGVMTRSGGVRGLMDRIAAFASSARSTQVATYLMGLVVFFDDYANTILVGSTMRPLTDRYRVAREKLAYIVDSTAAPVAGLAIFSTWIAFQVSTFSAHLPVAGLSPTDGYEVVVETLPYRFYCIFTLAFVFLVTVTGRDFGPMRAAEQRAHSQGLVVAKTGRPMVSAEATAMEPAEHVVPAAHRAVVPILAFIGTTLLLIFHRGGAFAEGADLSAAGIRQILYDGSGSQPLAVGALVGLLLASLLGLLGGMRSDLVRAAATTLGSMGVAIAILYLAWMIGKVCTALGTAPYLTALLGDQLPPLYLPLLVFLLGGVVAFATGSSWSTMSILLPLVVGLSFSLGELEPQLGGHLMMVICIGAVFEGSIFGDHCSPISDTTVMSSIASASDHIDHVKTQAPYALVTMGVAMVAGYFPAVFLGWNPWACIGFGLCLLVGVVVLLGRPTRPA